MHFLTEKYIKQVEDFTSYDSYCSWCSENKVFGVSFKEFCCLRGFVEQAKILNVEYKQLLDTVNNVKAKIQSAGNQQPLTRKSCCGGGEPR